MSAARPGEPIADRLFRTRRRGVDGGDSVVCFRGGASSGGVRAIGARVWNDHAPRASYVGCMPTPGKMILLMGSYCFHSCSAHDIMLA
jgi:hypothetical protein